MEVKERIQLEYQALAALQKTSEIYDMPEVLRLLIRDLQEIGASEAKRYEKQRQALVEVMEEHGFCTEFQLEIWYHVNERICIMNEYLYAGRMEKQMTQEDVSDGICAVETYSRIETGKRTASRKNYLKLAERLDMNWGYYRGQIVTDDYEDFSLMTEQRIAVYQSKLPEAEKLLEQLKQKLSLTEIENRQYVDFMHLVIEKQKENMTWEEALEEYKRILAYTISDVYHINRYLTKTELELIYNIVSIYRGKKEYKKAEVLLKSVLDNCSRSGFQVWQEIGGIKRLYAGVYADLGEYDKCIAMTQKLIGETITNQDVSLLIKLVNLIGWSVELKHTEDKTIYISAYNRAIYLCDLYELETVSQIYQTYYKKNVDASMLWYE